MAKRGSLEKHQARTWKCSVNGKSLIQFVKLETNLCLGDGVCTCWCWGGTQDLVQARQALYQAATSPSHFKLTHSLGSVSCCFQGDADTTGSTGLPKKGAAVRQGHGGGQRLHTPVPADSQQASATTKGGGPEPGCVQSQRAAGLPPPQTQEQGFACQRRRRQSVLRGIRLGPGSQVRPCPFNSCFAGYQPEDSGK